MRLKLEQISIVLLILAIPIFLYFYVSTKSEVTINGQVTNFGAKDVASYIFEKIFTLKN